MTRINFVKSDSRILLSSFLAIFFLVACQKQPVTSFGNTFVQDNNNAKIVVADTFSTDLSTIYLDSVSTAGTSTMLVGRYTDPAFGKVASRSFLQIGPPSVPAFNYPVYDSVALLMRINRSYYGDTTLTQTFTVNQVSSLYQLPYQQYSFYSNSSFPIDPTPLGSADVTISPNVPFTTQHAGDSVKIKLSDVLGKDLFNKVYNNSDTITNSANFLYYFKGLCISPSSSSNGVVYGFRDTVTLRVYYHEPGVVLTNKFLDFVTTNPSYQFNNITPDWTGTQLTRLAVVPRGMPQTPPATPSEITGNAAYLQPASGLQVKITFPTLRNLLSRPDYLSVLRATLTVRPVPGSYSTTWRLPPAINLFATDLNNLKGGAISGTTASGSVGVLTGDLVVDYLYGANTAYTYDVTAYIQQQIALTTPISLQNGLIMDMPAPANTTTFNRAVLADKTYPVDQRVSLKIYYVSLYLNQ